MGAMSPEVPAEAVNNGPGPEDAPAKEVEPSGITYEVIGDTLQGLSVYLPKGESIYTETGKMAVNRHDVEMETKMKGGITAVVRRALTKESLLLNKFTARKRDGELMLTTDSAGEILGVDLEKGKPGVVAQRGAFLCGEEGVDLKIRVTKIMAGLFGGKGFILERLTGQGKAHLIASGEIKAYDLEPNESIEIDQGNLLAYEDDIDFGMKVVKGGPFNWVLGGEGLLLCNLKAGPKGGKIWTQTRKRGFMEEAAAKGARRAAISIG